MIEGFSESVEEEMWLRKWTHQGNGWWGPDGMAVATAATIDAALTITASADAMRFGFVRRQLDPIGAFWDAPRSIAWFNAYVVQDLTEVPTEPRWSWRGPGEVDSFNEVSEAVAVRKMLHAWLKRAEEKSLNLLSQG